MDWEIAYKNTTSLKVPVNGTSYTTYIKICKHCNKKTKARQTDTRQLLGNVIQSITVCACGRTFVQENVMQ